MGICTIKKVYIRFYYINVFIKTCVQLKIRNVHEMSRYYRRLYRKGEH